jgi:hypothetical protein
VPEGERILSSSGILFFNNMADLRLDLLVVPVNSLFNLAVMDNSTYTAETPVVTTPKIEITVPGFALVELDFNFKVLNLFSSEDLGLTEVDATLSELPDGIYYIKYSVIDNATTVSTDATFLRIDKIQQKFDEAFMKLDMMECDGRIKKQSKNDLMSIYFFIQGAVSAANNCATVEADKLYQKANRLLDIFINNDCGCSGNNALTSYY